MNIFYLDHDVTKCAEMHVNKHVVKMIVEYAQILSTTHRVLDGTLIGTKYMFLNLKEMVYYKATHVNHPSTVWARQSSENYKWLASMFVALCAEYTYRYGKTHKTEEIKEYLITLPSNIPVGNFTEPTPAMPDEFIVENNAVQSYQNYYNGNKRHLHLWKNRTTPSWIV